jgi:hypothetical protein
MRARISAGARPGTAIIHVTDMPGSDAVAAFAIRRREGPNYHLQDKGQWGATPPSVPLRPDRVDTRDGELQLAVGPHVVDQVAGLTVRLTLFSSEGRALAETSVAFLGLLLSAAGRDGSPQEPAAVIAEPPVTEPAAPPAPLISVPEQKAPLSSGKGNVRLILAAGIAAAVIVIAAGAYFLSSSKGTTPAPAAVVSVPAQGPSGPTSVRQLVADYLATNPSPDAAYARGTEFLHGKQPDGAFLVYRYAAEHGSAPAAVSIGRMYDPRSYSKETSPFPGPNSEQALEWYKRAASAGNTEAPELMRSLSQR